MLPVTASPVSDDQPVRSGWVTFNEADHTYSHSITRESYISATTVIGRYKQPFDGPYWSLYKGIEEFLSSNGQKSTWWDFKRAHVDRKPKEADRLLESLKTNLPHYLLYILSVQQLILARWEEKKEIACQKGTAYHLFREMQAYQMGEQTLSGTDITARTGNPYSFDLKDLCDGYHAELLVYSHPHRVAGQVDRLWSTAIPVSQNPLADHPRPLETTPQIWLTNGVPCIRFIDIDDFKTNEKIKTENKYQSMKYPLEALDDCNHAHYSLQISLYAYLMELQGFTPRHLRFTHIVSTPLLDEWGQPQYDTETGEALVTTNEIPYILPYLRSEVISLLDHYTSTLHE